MGVPVALYREAQQHTDDLLRELVLIAGFEAARGSPGTATRLAVTGERVLDGATGGTVTIEYDVDAAGADSSDEWSRMLDELGELCRGGSMLVVPARDEVVAFSRWFCEEFVRQLREGAAPRSWQECAVSR